MVTGSLARRYAKAVFELAQSQNVLANVSRDLNSLAGAMNVSAELASLMTNPAVRRAERRNVVDAIMAKVEVHTITRNLIYVLLDGERMASVPAIARELQTMVEAKAGRVSAEVTSAQALNETQVAGIKAALEKLAGKHVDIIAKQDPALLGGLVAKVGDVIYDGSVRSQLRGLRDELTK